MNKILIIIILSISTTSFAKHYNLESVYQDVWCNDNKGVVEVVLSDGTRCDCLTDKYAVEFDFSSKWAEAIGQSLRYARLTGKKAGIALIIENKKDEIQLNNLLLDIKFNNLPITVFPIRRYFE